MSSFEPKVPVSEPVYKATKAIAATITTVAGVFTLFGTAISDGDLSWGEGGTLIGGIVTAIATITAVWTFKNEVKDADSR